MKSLKLRALVVVLLIVMVIPINLLNAEESRHPENLENLVEESLRNYDEFLNWLRFTGLADRYNVNLSDVKDVIGKSHLILEEVYRNATLSMFIGGLELKHLKIFSQLSEAIDKQDIASLLKVVALELNISKISFSCKDVFTKFFTNMVKPGTCNYTEIDLNHLTWYTITLYKGLPSDRLTSILSKIYTIKMVLKVKAVYKDVLNKLLDELLYRESIVLYSIVNDIISTSKIIVVIPTQKKQMLTIPRFLETRNEVTEKAGKAITFEDVEKALNILSEIMKLLQEYDIHISFQDVVNIVSYVLSMDVEEASKFLENIDINYLKYLSRITPIYYNSGIKVKSVEEGRFNISDMSMNIPEDVYSYVEYEEFAREFNYMYMSIGEGFSNSSEEVKGKVVDIDTALKQAINSKSLGYVIEKLNTVSITIPLIIQINSIDRMTTTITRRTLVYKQVAGKEESDGRLLIYLSVLVLALTSLITALIFKPHIVLSILSRFSKIFSKSSLSSFTLRKNRSVLEFFWDLVRKLALILSIKISDSDTHREAYAKLVSKIEDEDLKRKLKDITKGYEVLRFSDKPYVDIKQWVEVVKNLIDELR